MGPRISGSVSSQTSPETTNTTSVETKTPATTSEPAQPKAPQQESKASEKNAEGSRQHATEQKSQQDVRGQYLKDQLETKFLKGPGGGSADQPAVPVELRDTGTVHAGPDNRTIADRVKVAGDGTGTPPPTTVKEFVYDKVADKIKDAIGDLKPDLKREVHPKISAEQEALHDVAAGLKKYQAYAAYAQNAAAILKVAPNNLAAKQALEKTIGSLDDLAKNLEKGAATLGKIGKYANLASDAIGTAKAVRELVQNTPKDFSDRKAMGRFADSLKNTADSAQAWFDRGKDALLAAGKSGAGVAFSYITGMVSIGVDGLKAGVGNVNKYIDRLEENRKLIENGGIKPKDIPVPDPPPPVKTYKQLQLEEHNEKTGKVYRAVDNEFATARDGVKKAFQARHREVHDKFDNEVLPKLYQQHRQEFIKQLRNDLKTYSSDQTGGSAKTAAAIKDQLTRMEGRGSQPSTAQLQAEIRELQVYYGANGAKLPVDKMLKQYQPELDKFYEKHGLGEGALGKEYAAHGLTDKNRDELYSRKLRELGLDQLPF
jgi:hypothetical protein